MPRGTRGASVRAGLLLGALLLAAAALGPSGGPASAELRVDDLEAVRSRGSLRVLVPRQDSFAYLPRSGRPLQAERDHAAAFARELGVRIEWVYVEGFDDLLPALLEGQGDLVVDNLTVTQARKQRVAFSAPVTVVREQIVARADEAALRSPSDLEGRELVVRASSSHWERLEALRVRHPGIELRAAPEDMNIDEILARVESGEFDLSVADSNLVRPVLDYRSGLRVALDLEGVAVIAWALRPEAIKLRAAVDAFLTRTNVASSRPDHFVGDLRALRRRGVLRVLTRNNAANYYIWNGQLMGFEYELARAFADRLGLELEMVVPPSHSDLLPWLREGRGDLVAASLTATAERAKRDRITFSHRTHRVSEVVVSRRGDGPIREPEDLAGRRFHVRRGSHYWLTLAKLRDSGVPIEIEPVPDFLETEEIIERVAKGHYDLTLADSHIVDIELTWRDDVRAALPMGGPLDLGWAVRGSNPKLLEAVNRFLGEEYRGLTYNVLAQRYFGAPKRIRRHAVSRPKRAGRISPYDAIVRRHAATHGFDWRLIAAQMHQESRFDPKAVSFAGARGLLQLMPRTAEEFGVVDLEDPEAGIGGGVRYLAWLRARFDERLPVSDRNWFALASYNAGHGHVRDARSLARQRGLDPDRWFGHVEQAMLLKRRHEIAAATRFGYCRCDEPVRYVRAVRDRYRAYVRVAGNAGGDPG